VETVDSFEWNKIAGAVLFAMLVVKGLLILDESVINKEPEEAKGWQVPGVEATESAGAAAPKEEPLAVLLAKGNADEGAKTFKKCMACHTIEKGGPNKVGPNLYNTVGNHFGHMQGFAYSDAVKNHPGTWGYEELNHWLTSPRAFIPGNKMGFAGLPDAQDRANVILFLKANAENPPPLPAPPPEAPAAAPAEGAAPADGAAPPADGAAPAGAAPAAPEAPAAAPAHAG
jgi:cytochrome c